MMKWEDNTAKKINKLEKLNQNLESVNCQKLMLKWKQAQE